MDQVDEFTGRKSIMVVTNLPARRRLPNGFCDRLYYFVHALTTRFDVVMVPLCDVAQDPQMMVQESLSVAEVAPVGTRHRNGPIRSRARHLRQLAIHRLPTMAYPCRPARLIDELRSGRCDAVVLHTAELAHFATLVPKAVPVIAVLEENFQGAVEQLRLDLGGNHIRRALSDAIDSRLARRVYRMALARSAASVVISDAEAASFAGMGNGRIVVVPHGVDVSYFDASPSGEQTTDVLMVAEFSHGRNAEAAVAVYRAAKQRNDITSMWRWTFAGRGSTSLPIQDDNVLLAGEVDDVRPAYRNAKVVIVPAERGTGVKTTLLQAWAMSRPVVASRFATIGAAAVPGQNVVVCDDHFEMVDAIDRLLRSPREAERLGAAGRRTACESHALDARADEFLELCAAVLADGGRGRS